MNKENIVSELALEGKITEQHAKEIEEILKDILKKARRDGFGKGFKSGMKSNYYGVKDY